MAGKWPYKRVEDIALKIAMGPFGSSIKVETFTNVGIPIISGQHLRQAELTDGDFNFITEEHANSLKNANVQRGDVVFTHAGNIGQVAFIPENSAYQRYVISQRQFYLRCNTDLMLPEFITYYFKSPEGQHRLLANANQVGVPSIARPSSYLKTIEVPVPSIEEQLVVVQNIKTLDAKIRSNAYINQTLEAMAQAIFKSWFVDFEPVKAMVFAKKEGRDPLRSAMSAISGKPDAEIDALPREQFEQLAATAVMFPEEMEESEFGEVPRGWSFKKFGDFIDRISVGKKFDQKSAFADGEVPILDQGKSGIIGFHNEAPGVCASLEKPVVVFANHTCYMRLITFNFSAIQNVLPFVGKDVDTVWVYYATKDKVKFSEYKGHWPDFVLAKAVVPNSDLTDYFGKIVQPLVSQMRMLELESEQLTALRDTLLRKLICEELSAADAVEAES